MTEHSTPAVHDGALPDPTSDSRTVPAKLGDAVGDLRQAWTAVQHLHGDAETTPQTAVVCAGTS